MENGVSRSSLVHGTQTNPNSDTWYDTDAFLLDQVKEVLNKLSEGSIDDEIWGKIVIMERCKRVAKAYLRKTTVIIDGSEDEFDGKTLGFNHFENSTRDEHTREIRAKIADGVILRMDYQGNIKGMARGATPIVCQGWKEPRSNCISDRLVRLHGKLNHGGAEEDKAYKVFDMRKFKHSLEREIHDGTHDARALLLKTCLRIALVKDGGDMNRTPCWFAVVNLVALDMVKEKVPTIKSLLNGNSLPPMIKSSGSSASSDPLDAQTLTQIIAAAVSQANKGMPNSNANSSLAISPEQLAQIASTISIAQTNTMRTSDLSTMNNKNGRKKPYHCSTSSLDSSGEDSSSRRSEIPGVKGRAKRWENANTKPQPVVDRYAESPDLKVLEKTRAVRSHRPLLQDAIFTRSHSITSDYDSNKEHFDSGSWSSTQSRYKLQGGRSTSSSVVSDHDIGTIGNLNRNELKECTEIKEANSTTDDEQDTNPSPAPNVPTLPRKDYNLEKRVEENIIENSPSPPVTPQPEPHHYENQHAVNVHANEIETESFPTPTPPPKFPNLLVRRISSVCDRFLPKLEGTPTWTANTTRKDEDEDDNDVVPPLPPPLPETPLPDGIPASPQYNAFNSHPTFYDLHHKMGEFHSGNCEEVEVYFGRTPEQPDQQRNRTVPFVSELRQVLEQRTNGFRIARNHSQPATAHPSLRQYATKNNQYQTFNSAFGSSSNGRKTPERTPSQISNSQVPRGLRRTFNEQFIRQQQIHQQQQQQHQQQQQQQQQQHQNQHQRAQHYNYGQSTMCREQAPVARVNRTGSLPWGQWQHMRRTHM